LLIRRLAAVAVLLGATSARAADVAFPAERLRPAMDHTGILDVESGETLGFFEYDLSLWVDYARNPLVLYRKEDGDFTRAGALVQDRVGAHLVGAMSFFWVEVGLRMPVTLYQDRSDSEALSRAAELDAVGIGDLQIAPKVQLLHASQFGFDLAALLTLTVPTAVPKDSFNGERTVSAVPELAMSMPAAQGMRVAANLGYRVRQNSRGGARSRAAHRVAARGSGGALRRDAGGGSVRQLQRQPARAARVRWVHAPE
jgi:hypothetical protein